MAVDFLGCVSGENTEDALPVQPMLLSGLMLELQNIFHNWNYVSHLSAFMSYGAHQGISTAIGVLCRPWEDLCYCQ